MSHFIYTIGHSTHPWTEFVDILKSFKIKRLVDVRTVPKSRFNPQFNMEHLHQKLPIDGIEYQHMSGLGGLRHARKDSVNLGWRNASFRGYADYMQTEEFKDSLKELMIQAKKAKTAIMCAEAVPWRCHRSMIADALLVHGFEVKNIMGLEKETSHKLNPMAKVKDKNITYPSVNDQQSFLE